METRQSARSLIRSAFPGRDLLIERVFHDHATFRELCEDYRRCVAALERWRRLNGAGPLSRTEEYSELLARLTEEIEHWLDEIESVAIQPRSGGAP
jgi:hypothetical protein